jgi:hypothetical protein
LGKFENGNLKGYQRSPKKQKGGSSSSRRSIKTQDLAEKDSGN